MASLVPSKRSLRASRKICNAHRKEVCNFDCSDSDPQILVVGNTLLYRHLATTRVSLDDRAVEIGCSYGHCTALFRCPALGVDIGSGVLEEAQRLYPSCRFICGDVLGDDLSWLERNATVLFLDIGGGEHYRRVMKALATCLSLMAELRLIVVKSKEVRGFLLRFEDSISVVARDLMASKREEDDAEAAEELAVEIRRRGGEIPVSLIHLLCCGPRLRYMVGEHGLLNFLKERAPLLQVIEVNFGPPEHRVRVQAAPGKVPPPVHSALHAVRQELAEKLRNQFRKSPEWSLPEIFWNLKRSLIKKFVAVASDPELYRQGSDRTLDERCVETWSDAWRVSVAMRHLHAFFLSSPEFAIAGSTIGEVATFEELCSFRVTWTGEPEIMNADTQHLNESMNGQRVILQVLDGNWCTGEDDTPKFEDLIVERAWLLVAGQVVERLTNAAGSH